MAGGPRRAPRRSAADIRDVTHLTADLRSRTTGGGSIRFPVSSGEDLAGNLYVADFGDGFFPPLGTGEIYPIAFIPEPSGVVLAAAPAALGLFPRRRRRGK